MRISDWSSDVCSSDLVGMNGLLLILSKKVGTETRTLDFESSAVSCAVEYDGHVYTIFISQSRWFIVDHDKMSASTDVAVNLPQNGRAACRERVGQNG